MKSTTARPTFRCFAACAPGLEPMLAHELAALGERAHVVEGGVEWDGDARSMMRANLWLRTASRVLVRIASFRATAFHELERRARRIEWAQLLTAAGRVDFRVTAHNSRLYHSDAIAERLLRVSGAQSVEAGARSADEHDEGVQLFVVRVVRDQFTISADTSGALLHMRGYRQAVGKAPLRETLAAALLLGAGWNGGEPLLDPFCGSGTIPIEAGLIARRVAPGSARRFAFMRWPSFDAGAWAELLAHARTVALASSPVAIFGSDRDEGAIAACTANARRAQVGHDIRFEARAISDVDITAADSGLVATNPPYGVRIGETRALRDLYARFGQIMRTRHPGWAVALYVPNRHLAEHTGLVFRQLFRTTNGGIPVSALHARVRHSS